MDLQPIPPKMKIQITGASGFVGQNLIEYLSYYQPQALSLRYKPDQSIRIDGDVTIHLAGKAHDLKKVSKPEDYYEANYGLTRQLFDAFLQSNAKKFIFVSSVKAVADSVKGTLGEGHPANPQTDYGKSKLLAENYLLKQKLPEGKSLYIMRPCMIHGPGNKGNLNLLYQFVSKGIPYPLAAYHNQRSFLSIENLCFIIKELIEGQIPEGIYHVADDESLSTNELVKEIALGSGRSARLWNIPPAFVNSLAKIGDKLSLPLNSERLQKLTESYVVSNAKIKKAIGKELPVSARQGLQKTIQSFQ